MSAPARSIRPIAVELEDFRGCRGRWELSLTPWLVLLVGENGSGKSSVLNAIEWCLFGTEVEKKSSGIAERGEWEVANREGSGRVRVSLVFELPGAPGSGGGRARLTRSRAAGAKAREEDELVLELDESADDLRRGYEVTDWLLRNGFPDWDTWKHAFCQHQELLRGRVTDTGQRSVQLGRLLGLEEHRLMRERIEAARKLDLAKRTREELETIEEELTRALESPGRELREIEERLEARGLARAEVGEPAIASRTAALVDEARRIARDVGLDASVPESDGGRAEDVSRRAREWEPTLSARRRELEREEGELRRELGDLESAVEGIEPARRRRRDAERAWSEWGREHGSEKSLEEQAEGLERERRELREEEKSRSSLRALLRQALDELGRTSEEDRCPVCESPMPSLADSLRDKLRAEGDTMTGRLARIDEREKRLGEQRAELARLRSELDVAEAVCKKHESDLEARLAAGGSEAQGLIDELPRIWRARIAELGRVVTRIDEHLPRHRENTEVLEILLRWRAARSRAEAATGELERLEAWEELQAAVDEAACLAVDLEALAGMARAAQQERSEGRVREVNAKLGAYFARIGGERADRHVHVEVKTTATRLNYRLVDGAGQNLMPILNQAALNALSFAMLFAQAADRARRGLAQWVLLDDPGQSLDESSLTGLAAVVAEVSQEAPVLLATFPGALEESVARAAPGAARVPITEVRS